MRIVEERVLPVGVGRLTSGEGSTIDLKEYLNRVAKYVPAEIVAAYLSASGVATLSESAGTLLVLIFGICLVCTPLYITRFASTRKEAWVNGTMATIAFVIWAYATGTGVFQHFNKYDPAAASVTLILFTVVSGLVIPTIKAQAPMGAIGNQKGGEDDNT